MTHLIKHLSFGKDYPGIVNPLDGTNVAAAQGMLLLVINLQYQVFGSKFLPFIGLSIQRHELGQNTPSTLEFESCH